MHVPNIACYTCGNRLLSYAQARYPAVINGELTEKERFALLDISSYYPEFRELRASSRNQKKAFSRLQQDKVTFADYKATEGRRLSEIEAFILLGVSAACCRERASSPPVWSIYSPKPPPGSLIELDKGEIGRITTNTDPGGGFSITELRPNQDLLNEIEEELPNEMEIEDLEV